MKSSRDPQSRSALVANLLLAIALAAAVYAAVRLLKLRPLDLWAIPPAALFVLIGVLIFALFVRFPGKLNLAMVILSLLVGAWIMNQGLRFLGRDLIAIYDAKVVRRAAGPAEKTPPPAAAAAASRPAAPEWQSPRPAVSRDPSGLIALLNRDGIKFGGVSPPFPLLPLIDAGELPEFLPLSSQSRQLAIGCNEGDQRDFPLWRFDRYGYNNDDTVYAYPAEDRVLIIGDSFAQGSCVHQDEGVAGQLTRNGYPATTVGTGGNGPLLGLATLAEYGARFRPKTVLWMYFDGNDVVDLRDKELRSRLLLRYLTDGFTQNLVDRQAEVDAFWTARAWEAPLNAFDKDTARKAAWEQRLQDNLPLVQATLGKDIASLSDDDQLVRVFGRIMAIAKRRVAGWGGRLVVAIVPNKDDYHGSIPRYRLPVLEELKRLDLPVVDVDTAIRASGDPLAFYPVRNDWGHFNARGYALMARQVMEALEAR